MASLRRWHWKRLSLLLATLGFISLFALAPNLLEQQQIRATITSQLNHYLGMECRIGGIGIGWYPFPHLLIKQVSGANQELDIDLPQVRILPRWRSIFSKQVLVSRVLLKDPKVLVHSWPKGDSSTLPTTRLDLAIDNGQISLPIPALPHTDHTEPLLLNTLQGRLTFDRSRVKFEVRAASPFSQGLRAIGRLDLNKNYYRIDAGCRNFNLSKLFPSLGPHLIPADRQVDFSAHLEGLTSNNFTLTLNGQPPSVWLTGREKSSLIEFNTMDSVKLERYDEDLFLTMNGVELTEPHLILGGTVRRQLKPESDNPDWFLDLNARDIDATAVRRVLLEQLGHDELTQEVLDVVRGGTVTSARYLFQGPVEDFAHLDLMKIWFDVAEARIYIPDIKLMLDRTRGKATIFNGNLAGIGLSAETGSSIGRNCDIFLDLTEKNDAFNLDLDLDVDLSELRQALTTIVDDDLFQNELSLFQEMQGRAQGHMSLGDNLNDIDTTILISGAKGEGRYGRLPWPFRLHKAQIDVYPERVEWRDTLADLGPHRVKQSHGSVDWAGQDITLNLDSLAGVLDSTTLHRSGSLRTDTDHYELSNFLDGKLDHINGEILIDNASIKGPADRPEEWRFLINAKSPELQWKASLLPEETTSRQLSAVITDRRVTFNGESTFLGQQVRTRGKYHHRLLDSWNGQTEISAVIDNDLARWIKDQQWIGLPIFPKTPFRIQGLTVSSSTSLPDEIGIKGRILSGIGPDDTAWINLDIRNSKNQVMNAIAIGHDQEYGQIVYNTWHTVPEKSLFTWQGVLSSATLEHFFSDLPVQSGMISGACSILQAAPPTEDIWITGYMEAQNLLWQPDQESVPLRAQNLRLSGSGQKVMVEEGRFQVGRDDLELVGQITIDHELLELEMEARSPSLAWSNIDAFLDATHDDETELGEQETLPPESKGSFRERLRGYVEFSFDNLQYLSTEEGEEDTEEPPHLYNLANLEGALELGEDYTSVGLAGGTLCGIELSGDWNDEQGEEETDLSFSDRGNLNFQATLPCLGFEQSLVDGTFSLDGDLQGMPDSWQDGKVLLTSKGGVIRKMNLLSKIFSVVNFTEFFTFEEAEEFKTKGLPYNDLTLAGEIKENVLIIEKVSLNGKGLNITGQGRVDLDDFETDITMFVAPFKMIDSVVTKIPLVGKALGGEKGAILTFPVGVKGPLEDPTVTPLPPSAIGKATLQLIKDTLTLPFAIFSTLKEGSDESGASPESQP